MNKLDKILISGSGRSGTTFLMLIYIFLDQNTAFSKANYLNYIYESCNSGLETGYNNNEALINKNPEFMNKVLEIIKCEEINVKYFIIPIRKFEECAKSREKYSSGPGGFVYSSNYEEQLQYFKDIYSNYLYMYVKYSIPTIFIDFDKMISDPLYLYEKLLPTFQTSVSFENFKIAYDRATNEQRKK